MNFALPAVEVTGPRPYCKVPSPNVVSGVYRKQKPNFYGMKY